MKKTPEVSVVMAVKNGFPIISEAVDSVLSQSFKDFELIVIDDGSDDSTTNYLLALSTNDSKVKTIINPVNIGLTKSLNLGIRIAKGKWIARIDHDDLWHPEKLMLQISFLKNHPFVKLIGSYTSNLSLKSTSSAPFPSVKCISTDIEIRSALYKYNPFVHSSVVFCKDTFNRVGCYNEDYRCAQDYELWTRFIKSCSGYILPEILCIRRTGTHNISVKRAREQRYNAIKSKLNWIKFNGWNFSVIPSILKDTIRLVFP